MHYGIWLKDQNIDAKKYFGQHSYYPFGKWELPEELHNSKWTADKTIEAVDMAQEKDKPFFIWSSFQDPHNPWMVPEPWINMYKRKDIPVPEFDESEFDNKPPFYKSKVEKGHYDLKEELGSKDWHCVQTSKQYEMHKKKYQNIMASYYAMISLMDHHIGRIFDALEERNMLDNTIIIFTSDHGDYLGNHGLWWKGLPAYEDIHRIPLIIAHPECRTKGTQSNALHSHVDFGNSFLHAAGIKTPPLQQGCNQIPAWLDNKTSIRDWALIEFRPTETDFMQKVFYNQDYKLVLYHNMKYGELYDIKSDPHQKNNLWDDPDSQQLKQDLIYKFIRAEMEKDGTLRTRLAPA
jgi:uncharacterized sulfatase